MVTSSVIDLSTWTGVSDSFLVCLFINEKVQESSAERGGSGAAEGRGAVNAEVKSTTDRCALHVCLAITHPF